MFVKLSEEVIESLESPAFTLEQVSVNVAEIEALCHKFTNTDAYKLVTEIDKKTGLNVAKIVHDAYPNRLRYLIANSMYDLRHTCDQISCAAVFMSTGIESRNVYFPIGNSKADFDGRVTSSIPEEFQVAFYGFKGYPSIDSENPMGDALCALSKAAQRKHSIHCRPTASVRLMQSANIMNRSKRGVVYVPPKIIHGKNEMVLGTYEPGTTIEYNASLTIGIELLGAGKFDGSEPVALIQYLHSMVSQILDKVRDTAFSSI